MYPVSPCQAIAQQVAREAAKHIQKVTEDIWKQRVDIWKIRSQKVEETKSLLKQYQQWNIEGNLKIQELEELNEKLQEESLFCSGITGWFSSSFIRTQS